MYQKPQVSHVNSCKLNCCKGHCKVHWSGYLVSLMVLSRAPESSRLSCWRLKARPRMGLMWMGMYWQAFMVAVLIFFTPKPAAERHML